MSAGAEGLEGELSFARVPELLRHADALAAGGSLDLGRVTRTDSAGLALLLELGRRGQARGKPLLIRGASKQVVDFASFFGLDKILRFE
jgi:phospholipid transport system transporter-binding protein